MRAQPYLCLGGIEVGNALRTLNYLRRGLGGASWDAASRTPIITEVNCVDAVVGDVYTDLYTDLYGGSILTTCDPVDALDPRNLVCYCSALDDGSGYVDPATDGAPWYVAAVPASGEFLGFVPNVVRVRPTLTRSMSHGVIGAVLGPPTVGGHIVEVEGIAVAMTDDGMAYGDDWMRAALSGGLCDPDPTLSFLPSCPPDGRDPRWRNLRHVGLIDGPVMEQVDRGVAECKVQRVAFQLGAECGWQLGDPDVLIDEGSIPSLGTQRWLVEVGEWTADAALRLVVTAGATAMLGVRLYATATTPGGDCPPAAGMRCFDFTLGNLQPGEQLVVDPVDRVAAVVDLATGDWKGGLDRLSYAAPWIWPELPACSAACVALTASTATGGIFTLERIDRDL